MSDPSINEGCDPNGANIGSVDSFSVDKLIEEIGSDKDTEEKERDYEFSFQDSFRQTSAQSEIAYTHLRGWQAHYEHKSYWSFFLMFIMSIVVGFQCLVIWMTGAKIWTFIDYKWLLPALLVQNFAQVVGLVTFVVKSLFDKMKNLDP